MACVRKGTLHADPGTSIRIMPPRGIQTKTKLFIGLAPHGVLSGVSITATRVRSCPRWDTFPLDVDSGSSSTCQLELSNGCAMATARCSLVSYNVLLLHLLLLVLTRVKQKLDHCSRAVDCKTRVAFFGSIGNHIEVTPGN